MAILEAEYAFERGKTIIPVVTERRYRPTGWLGMIIGTKYRYTITEENTEELSSIVKAIRPLKPENIP